RRWAFRFIETDLALLDARLKAVDRDRADMAPRKNLDLGYEPPPPEMMWPLTAPSSLTEPEQELQRLQEEFVKVCLAPIRVQRRRRRAAMKVWPVGASTPPPRLEELQHAQVQWRAFFEALRDLRIGKAERLQSFELVPVVVKTENATEIRYRPHAFKE